MDMTALLAAIPYIELHGVELIEAADGAARVRLPDRPQMRNHVGTVHAGALFTLAETAGGVAAATTIPQGSVILLRGASVRYLKPAAGEVVAEGSVDPAAAAAASAAYADSKRSELSADVRLLDHQGGVLLEGAFDYAVREA